MTTYALVRYPRIQVSIDGVPLTDATCKVISAQCASGWDQRTSTAVIRCATLPPGTLKPLTTRVLLGLSANQQTDPPYQVFFGYLVEVDYTLWPRSVDLLCRGPLVKAEFYMCTAAGGLDMARFSGGAYLGDTDENMVRNVLQQVGLSTIHATTAGDPFFPVLLGEADGTHPGDTYTGTGTGKTLGVTNGAQFVWTEGETAMAYIERLDEVCLGYRTFEQTAGSIQRQIINPFAGAASPYAVFTEGVDIFSATGQQITLDARNRVQVTGYNPGGAGVSAANYAAQQANPLLTGYVTQQLSSQLIEKSHKADAGGGLSCEEVANWVISQVNRTLYKYTLVTPRGDAVTIVPGTTIQIVPGSQPSRLGLNGLYYVQNVAPAIDAHGAFSVTVIVIGGPGSTAPVLTPPGVDFTMQMEKELVVISGVETPLYTIHCIAAPRAVTAAIASYAWSTSGGAGVAPATGTSDTFTTTTTSLTSFMITLAVTDTGGLTGQTSKAAPPDDGVRYLVRKLYLAGTDTIDDFTTSAGWNVHAQTAATVVANAPIWGDGRAALTTANDLATAPTSVNVVGVGVSITSIWVETNVSSSNVLLGGSDGSMWHSTDGGATWTQLASMPDGNSAVKCLISGSVAGQYFALTGAHLYRSDTFGTGWVVVQAAAGGETFQDWVLSFARGMICMTGGRLMIDLAGNTQTFPGGVTGPIYAVTADIRADRFYCYDSSGNTYGHVNGGDTALVALTALNLGGGAAVRRGLWRDGNARGLLYYAAYNGGVWKSLDGFGSAGGYYQIRKPGVGSSPGGAQYTQIGADGLLFPSPVSGATISSTAGTGHVKNLDTSTSARFDATDDYLSTGTVVNSGGGDFSIAAWIKPAHLGGNFGVIVSEIGTENTAGQHQFRIADLTLELVRRTGVGTAVSIGEWAGLVAGSWAHVVGTSTSGVLALYVNGVAVTTTLFSGVYSAGAANTTNIGASESGSATTPEFMFDGDMSDVRIYSIALSSTDVANLYTPGLGAYPTVQAGSMQARWKFNEGSGTTAADTSGNSHTATWHGTGVHWGSLLLTTAPVAWYATDFTEDGSWVASVLQTGTVPAAAPAPAQWLCFAAVDFENSGQWLLRYPFTLGTGTITSAALVVGCDIYCLDCYVNGIAIPEMVGHNFVSSQFPSVNIPPSYLHSGSNLISIRIGNDADPPPNPSSVAFQLVIS